MGYEPAAIPLLTDRLEIRLGGEDKDRIRDRAAELGYRRGSQPDMTAYILDLVRADLATAQHTVTVGEAMTLSVKVRGLRLHPEDLRLLVEVERQVRAAGRFANELLRLDQTGRTPRAEAMAKAATSLTEVAARLYGLIDPPAGRSRKTEGAPTVDQGGRRQRPVTGGSV